MSFSRLFSPIQVGSLGINNRFVMPPMGTNLADHEGHVTDDLIEYYVTRARGGWGLIIVEIAGVNTRGKAIPYQIGIWNDKFIDGLRRLTSAVHEAGSKIALQIHHAGRQTTSDVAGGQPVAPSPIPDPVCQEVPHEMSTDEVYELISDFGDAAARAEASGFDAVEIHGAHGYMVAQFMSPSTNRRTDEFGGAFNHRMRMPLGVIQDIRSKVGDAYPLLFRLSADEMTSDGRGLNETRAAARLLEDAGVDCLHVSMGMYASMQYIVGPAALPPGYILDYAGEVKKSVNVPVIAVGRINDPLMAEDAIATGKGDLVAWGRQSLTEPELPRKIAEGMFDEIAPCIACNQGCIGYLFDPEHLRVSCLVNPFCGSETTLRLDPAEQPKDVVIVGGGPGGLEAAWTAAARGHRVTLFEKRERVGGQLIAGSISPTKQEIAKAIKYYKTMGEKYGVRYITGHEASVDEILQENPDVVVLAAGGKPVIPDIEGSDHPDIDLATDVLEGKAEIGTDALIAGGGWVGCEVADYLGERGCKVTIVEQEEEIAGGAHDSVRHFLIERLIEHDAEIIAKTEITRFYSDGAKVQMGDAEEELRDYDMVVLALGYTPNNELEKELEGKVSQLYVIGDAREPRQAIEAIEEGAYVGTEI